MTFKPPNVFYFECITHELGIIHRILTTDNASSHMKNCRRLCICRLIMIEEKEDQKRRKQYRDIFQESLPFTSESDHRLYINRELYH